MLFRPPKKLLFSRLYRYYFDFILRLIYRVIIFEGVPESIDETFFKLVLFTQGKICFFEPEGKLVALNCTGADQPTLYYMPSKFLVVNPRLSKSYTLTPGTDCEIVYCSETDKYNASGIDGGLYLQIERTATMLADNDISINVAQKNMRLVNLVSADTQNTVDSLKAVIAAMYEGDPNIIVKSSLIDKLQGIPILQNQSNHNLIELIELQQYILAHFYESIGLCTHDQIKKERLITAEINDNAELAKFNIDDIIATINEGLARVNARYNTEISCRLNPIIEEQTAAAADDDQTEDAAPDDTQTEDAAADDQIEDAAPDDTQTEDAAPDDTQTEDAAPDDTQTEDAAADDQTEDAAADDQTEDAAVEIQSVEISGDNNTIVIGGDANAVKATNPDDSEDMERDPND